MRQAWIISVGTELALGQTVDTNAAWLASKLARLGIRTQRQVIVPDDGPAIQEVLLQAARACDVILVSGGLGPTGDDLTRSALAGAAGVPLELHAPSLEHLRAFFAGRRRPMPQSNIVQAMIPRGAEVLPNTCGTAPGLRVEVGGTSCYALPGVPFEMRTMFEREVAPRLRVATGNEVLLTRSLHTFGLGESEIGQRLTDLMQPSSNPQVGTTAEFGVVTVRINAAAPSPASAQASLDAIEAEIRRRLGPAVYGRDDQTLAGVVGELLISAGRTVSTAESCTGGLIGTLLTDVAGSSRYYVGGVVAYANEAKVRLLGVQPGRLDRYGAVSEAVATDMACGAASVFGTDYALSTTGIAGPTGGTPQKPVGLVFVGLRSPTKTAVCECRFGPDAPRCAIRVRAARTALNLLRLALLGAGEDAGGSQAE